MELLIQPDIKLYVTGVKGDVTQRWANNEPLPVGKSVLVATLQSTSGPFSDLWGWVYLGSAPGKLEYQIYHERKSGLSRDYAFFGYFNPNSTEKNSNPSPFPPGVATADTNGPHGTYVLLREPPK
ncbi:MAG TPA: hypothetical protein VM694_27010 [Polyangium sp.]|jgi:hypothetical protein|nr:hypothetical protein [Polyangium sp.]